MKKLVFGMLLAILAPGMSNASVDVEASGIYSTFEAYYDTRGQIVAEYYDREHAKLECMDTRTKIQKMSSVNVVFITHCQESEEWVPGENMHLASTTIRFINPAQKMARASQQVFSGRDHKERCESRAGLLQILSNSEVSIVAKCVTGKSNDSWNPFKEVTKLNVLVIRK